MVMANNEQTVFGDFQIDERYKKLERSLKLTVLKKAHSDNGEVLPVTTSRLSISSFNVNSLNSSVTPSLQTSMVKSEVLASSNNLKNLISRKRGYKANTEVMATSSVKEYNIKQDAHFNDQHIMPPPMRNTVYRSSKETLKIPMDRRNSPNPSVPSSTVNTITLKSTSCISTNTNSNKEYSHPFVASMPFTNDSQKIDRVFSNWRVMLNGNYELLIKGTIECGIVVRSKPIIRRYSATCVESKYKHKYSLQGNIVDNRHVLPDYIRGKFYNGFPDDWENVYQIWRTYVNQGYPVTFRWPTPITDSDDDLKSEVTELAYLHTTNSKTTPLKKTYESIECVNSKNSNNNKSSKNEEKYHSRSFQRYEKNALFMKPFASNSEKDIMPIAQTKNIKLAHNEGSGENIENPVISSEGINKLKDVIHEDKLQMIIKNLAHRNCSPKYIDKIIEMLECLDYIVSYRASSESNEDSAVFVNCGMSSKPDICHLQSSLSCDDNRMNTNKLENDITKQWENGMHSPDLRHRSIKNNFASTKFLTPPITAKSKQNGNDSDESESETYAGVPKISKVEQLLHDRKTSGTIYKHKVRKKLTNLSKRSESAHETIPIANNNNDKNLLCDKSDISITEDGMTDTGKCEMINTVQKYLQDTFCIHPRTQRDNFNAYGTNKRPAVQIKQSLNAFEERKVNSNVKKQKVPHRIEENARSQFTDVEIDNTSNFDIDIATVSSANMQRRNENVVASHLDQDVVVISESNNNFPLVSRKSSREFIERPRSEIKKFKPCIISLVPVNLNLKIKKADDSKSEQLQEDVSNVENDESQQYNDIQLEEIPRKSISKMAANDKEKTDSPTNKENKSTVNPTKMMKLTNPTIEQSKSKLEVEKHPKVLCSWMPKVIQCAKSTSKLGLTFEGKLINEAGHVMSRKFATNIVLKRLSATLIETVNHEFYQLSGHLKDNNGIHKELARHCRNGCPADIEQFCLTWKRLQDCEIQKMNEKRDMSTNSLMNASVSSRGRRIMPPLSYWTGERITVKDNNLVYDPGNSQESSLIETSKEALSTEETKKQKVNSKNTSKEQKLLSKSNEIPAVNKNQTNVIETIQSPESPKTKAGNNARKRYKLKSQVNNERRKFRRIRENFSTTDSSEAEEQKVSPSKSVHTQSKTASPSQYALRKRYSPIKKTRHNMIYTYHKNILLPEDFLSEVTSM